MKSQQILQLEQTLMDFIKFSFDLSRIAVESMTSLLKSVEPQKVRSFLYFYYLLQSLNFLS